MQRHLLVVKNMVYTYRFHILITLAFLSVQQNIKAQGFGIYEHGTCAMGRGGATVANPCDDGSSIFFNPAGLAGTQGLTLSGGVTSIAVGGGFTDDTSGDKTDLDNDPILVPHVYAGYGVNDRLAVGLGVYVPYGLGTVWPIEFEGRFLGYDNVLRSIYVQPTVAYKVVEGLSIGAGLTYVNGAVELNQRMDLAPVQIPGTSAHFSNLGVPVGTDFADAHLEASGATGYGGHFGIRYEATDRLSLGARYLTAVKLDYEGDAEFTQVPTNIPLPAGNPLGVPAGTPLDAVLAQTGMFNAGGTLGPQTVETSIEMPAQLVAGVSYQVSPQLLLLADYQRTFWSSFDEIVMDFETAPNNVQYEDYEDTNGFRFGAEYTINDQWQIRAGLLTHGAAAPDQTVTPLLPEAKRVEVTAGIGWSPIPKVTVNAAYQYLGQSDRDGRVTHGDGTARPTAALNSGVYSFHAHILAATLTFKL